MSVNKVILVGNVGMNPEVRTTQDGKSVATFSLATSEKWKDKRSGERKEKSEWHRIVILSEGLISIVKNYVKKGMRLYIEGTIQTRKWVDKEGVDRFSTEIVLKGFNNKLEILQSIGSSEGKRDFGQSYDADDSSSYDNYTADESSGNDVDDDIPF